MNKEEHLDYWLLNADRDWNRAERCFKDKDYVFCLFCLHLSLEKICKALWIKEHKGNFPPKGHNLEYLLRQTKVELKEEDWKLLVNMNRFNLEGRYPDYKDKIYKECDKKLTNKLLKDVEKLKICLIEKLQ